MRSAHRPRVTFDLASMWHSPPETPVSVFCLSVPATRIRTRKHGCQHARPPSTSSESAHLLFRSVHLPRNASKTAHMYACGMMDCWVEWTTQDIRNPILACREMRPLLPLCQYLCVTGAYPPLTDMEPVHLHLNTARANRASQTGSPQDP